MVLERTGLIPHINAGVMSQSDVERLRAVSGSQGLMLESSSPRLMEAGGPHFNCPDKLPAARLATVRKRGRATFSLLRPSTHAGGTQR
jgi:FO synthase